MLHKGKHASMFAGNKNMFEMKVEHPSNEMNNCILI